jgi:hemolysin III
MEIGPYIQSPREESANSILHLVGLALSFSATAALVVVASRHGTARHIVSCSIYGATLIFLYLSSALYHSSAAGKSKRLLRYFDHNSIFLLIAGTYTPFTLITLRGGWGWSLFGAIWGLALTGIFLRVLIKKTHPVMATLLYLLMGWLVIIAIRPLMMTLPSGGIFWLVAGGLCYTFGVIFYGLDRFRYFHAVWHLFVLAGSACHFFSIFFYVLP